MRSSQENNPDCALADTIVPLLNSCLKQRLDHSTLDTRFSINPSTDLFNHYPAERMPNKYNRSAQLLSKYQRWRPQDLTGIGNPHTSCSSRLSIKLLSKLLAWSMISAAVSPKAASALYPNDMTRALGTSCGRKSLSQKAFVSRLVQVLFESPYRPWTATILGRECEYFGIFHERQCRRLTRP